MGVAVPRAFSVSRYVFPRESFPRRFIWRCSTAVAVTHDGRGIAPHPALNLFEFRLVRGRATRDLVVFYSATLFPKTCRGFTFPSAAGSMWRALSAISTRT